MTRGQELMVRRWAGAVPRGRSYKDASLHIKGSEKLLKNGVERSTRVNLNFNKITLTAVKIRFGRLEWKQGRISWWSREFGAFTAEGPGSIPGWGAKIPQVTPCGQKKKNESRKPG